MRNQEIMSAIESILFVYAEPMPIVRLGQVLEISEEEIARGLEDLVAKYEDNMSGLALVRAKDQIQLTTKGENALYIEKLSKSTLQESLSKAAFEVLAVIAYRGPIARAEIESIRGVNCSVTLRNLLIRELIERQENEDDARGYVYTITFQFLKELGLRSVEELPDYETLMHDERLLSIIEAHQASQQE
jgi:segregation and condensation protein B